MADFTAREQLMLELINRARMDPSGEAARYGISLNQGLASGTISTAPKQVLAGDDALALAADNHSQWMIATDVFSHEETGATRTPTQRMALAGYTFSGTWMSGENISYVGSTGSLDLTTTIAQQHRNLFLSPGHRSNILEDDFREVGVGQQAGTFQGYNASMVTQNFARSGTAVFVTGVVYDDTIANDNFFTVGEETASRAVSGSGASDNTGAGGGYELEYSTLGTKTITFDLATGAVSANVVVNTTNVKVDIVNGNEIWTNGTLTSLSTNVKELHALGLTKVKLTGTDAKEKIVGNSANNKLTGNGGNDNIAGGGGDDKIIGGLGRDKMSGGSSDDKFIFKSAADSTVEAPDFIRDFGDSGTDRIDLRALGDLAYRDEAKFNDVMQVRVTKDGSDVIVHINLSGDKADEMRIVLDNTSLSSMGSGDFIL
jgi:Ca2+-binding RTX toxin-like protein